MTKEKDPEIRDAERVRRWLERADEELKDDGLGAAQVVKWNARKKLIQKVENSPEANGTRNRKREGYGTVNERKYTHEISTIMELIQLALDDSLSEKNKEPK